MMPSVLAYRFPRSSGAVAAGLLTVGFYLYAGITYGTEPREGLTVVGTVGLPMLASCFLIAWGVIALAARRFPRLVPRAIVPACAVLAVALPLLGYRQSRPLARFEALLIDPAPQSLRDLRVEK